MKKRALAICFLSAAAIAIFYNVVAESFKARQKKQYKLFYQQAAAESRYEIPLCALDKKRQIVQRSGYALCYNERHEQADWVAYTLDSEKLKKNAKRTNDFRPDFDILTGSAALEDYRRSGYDRGHLAPAGDMAYDAQSMSESFLLSNISPQPHAFNEGVWNSLEQRFRKIAKEHEKIYIVTGPVLEKKSYPTIGANKVSVPEYFYKAALIQDGDNFQMEAYIIPASAAKEDYKKFRLSVDELEKRTKMDFFYLLDDAIENELESSVKGTSKNFSFSR